MKRLDTEEELMRKVLLGLILCTALILGISGSASAVLCNNFVEGDRVVYDTYNDLYWYPILTDFTGMTRSQQEVAIDDLFYAGTGDWRMATWTETSILKLSLAGMATVEVRPTDFSVFPDPSYANRTLDSPYCAWDVDSAAFFTPTGEFDFGAIGLDDVIADVFNGRTTGWGVTNTGPDGFWGDLEWVEGSADDHWVSSSYINEGDENLTMTFNFDQHLRDDDATSMWMGGIGAWVVTENVAPVPEPGTIVLMGVGLAGLAGFGRRRFKK
jgi:hypothetical protein